MYYYDILKEFYLYKIKYLIVGGLSVNLHGIPRVTQDIDIIISMDKTNILETVKVLTESGFLPKLPVKADDLSDLSIEEIGNTWIVDKNLKAFTFYIIKNNFEVLDILLVHPLDFNMAFDNKTVKTVLDIEIFIASIDDIIVMKKFNGRNQDLSDIKLLEKLKIFLKGKNV
jgi:hypothetical protein